MTASALQTRGDWLAMLQAISAPVLAHGAARTLKAAMPVETVEGAGDQRAFAHLETCGRTLAGLAPWLELGGIEGEEAEAQHIARQQAQALVASVTDPASPDYVDFGQAMQPLVDAAFLAQAILRAPTVLWNDQPGRVRANIIREMSATRAIAPPATNWLLFSAMVETFFAVIGLDFERLRIDHAIDQFGKWYVGDGWYSDGPVFHFDYYNSLVIHPFLVDMARVLPREPDREGDRGQIFVRAQRHGAQLERMIAPDGSMPAIGRSLAYRSGNLHLLAQLALLHGLPHGLAAGQVREAMSRAMRRSLSAPGIFDDEGWLTIGYAGHQPGLAEPYISTGSLYLCTAAFLPLGLPADDLFWTDVAAPPTLVRLNGGQDVAPDRAMED